jgi:hypothetical protein
MLIIRPPFFSRMWTDAARLVLYVPFKCTARTMSHSSSVMLKIMRSRRMPATLTRMSIRPQALTACSTMAVAWDESDTEP